MYAEANIDPLSCVQYFCNRLASTPMLVNLKRRLLGTLSPRKYRKLVKVSENWILRKIEEPDQQDQQWNVTNNEGHIWAMRPLISTKEYVKNSSSFAFRSFSEAAFLQTELATTNLQSMSAWHHCSTKGWNFLCFIFIALSLLVPFYICITTKSSSEMIRRDNNNLTPSFCAQSLTIGPFGCRRQENGSDLKSFFGTKLSHLTT